LSPGRDTLTNKLGPKQQINVKPQARTGNAKSVNDSTCSEFI